jgi:hypothetical protein
MSKLLEAQKAAKPVEKQGKNTDQNYSYARAEDVIREAQDALHSAGLVGMMTFSEAEERPITSKSGTAGVYCLLRAKLLILEETEGSSHRVLEVDGFGAGIDYPGDKAIYKAMTGAAKYAYASALGIPFGDDPEDSTTSAPEAREAAEKPKGFIVKADGKSPQKDFLRSLLGKAEANQPETIIAWLDATQEGGRDGGISRAIDKLKENPKDTAEELEALAEAWAAENSDIPGDEADLPPADNGKQETLA